MLGVRSLRSLRFAQFALPFASHARGGGAGVVLWGCLPVKDLLAARPVGLDRVGVEVRVGLGVRVG